MENKVVIVTGGLGQLGSQYVRALHERGAKVAVFVGKLAPGRAEKVLGDIHTSPRLFFAEVNITDKAAINKALD